MGSGNGPVLSVLDGHAAACLPVFTECMACDIRADYPLFHYSDDCDIGGLYGFYLPETAESKIIEETKERRILTTLFLGR